MSVFRFLFTLLAAEPVLRDFAAPHASLDEAEESTVVLGQTLNAVVDIGIACSLSPQHQ